MGLVIPVDCSHGGGLWGGGGHSAQRWGSNRPAPAVFVGHCWAIFSASGADVRAGPLTNRLRMGAALPGPAHRTPPPFYRGLPVAGGVSVEVHQ